MRRVPSLRSTAVSMDRRRGGRFLLNNHNIQKARPRMPAPRLCLVGRLNSLDASKVRVPWRDVEAERLRVIPNFPDKRVFFFDFEVVPLHELASEQMQSGNPAALAMSGAMRVDRRERAKLAVKFLESTAEVQLSEEERKIVVTFVFGHQRLGQEEQLRLWFL
jgi:hypothetical protein